MTAVNKERLLTILLAPHVSEKAALASHGYRQYIFKVLPDATKIEIKQAIENLFKVQVRSVRICNMKSKPARHGRRMGRHQAWKKAYVSLVKDQEIDITNV